MFFLERDCAVGFIEAGNVSLFGHGYPARLVLISIVKASYWLVSQLLTGLNGSPVLCSG